MHDECSALDMAQEFMAQALALVSAFDKARNVSHDEVVLVALHNAQVRNKRGERIIGDFGARGAHAGDERAFARGRHANERGVGHELHLELNPAFLRGFAQLGERGGAARGGHEMDVAATAMAAFRDDDALAVMRKVGDKLASFLLLFGIFMHHRAHRNLQNKIVTRGAMHALAHTVGAARCLEMMFKAVVEQRRDRLVGLEHDVAAMAAVAAVGAALGNMGLAAEAQAARAAVAALHVNAYFVYEHSVPIDIVGAYRRLRAACPSLCRAAWDAQ